MSYLELDPRYDGGCPCAMFEVDGTLFEAHCWRVCPTCRYAGLHYRGSEETALAVFADIKVDWPSTEWTLVPSLREAGRIVRDPSYIPDVGP